MLFSAKNIFSLLSKNAQPECLGFNKKHGKNIKKILNILSMKGLNEENKTYYKVLEIQGATFFLGFKGASRPSFISFVKIKYTGVRILMEANF